MELIPLNRKERRLALGGRRSRARRPGKLPLRAAVLVALVLAVVLVLEFVAGLGPRL